ncbi:MAG: heterodisulfide reductase [Desulfobacteraceae bacterium]|nr:MAG: heterodisulfide reductase [Desulfobacteraceae bacterium]
MSETYLVEPDVGFIKEVAKLGGQDLKKCYQCATCSVACPISPDTKPFPRKEMLAASWGLKDRLVGNGDIWLCHNCGDCSTRCPRGAKPGDVLSAVRAYAVAEYATPRALGKAVNDPSKLLILLAVPAVIFLVVGLLLKMVGINWLNFAPTGTELWQADYISNYLVDIIMVPTFFAAIAVFALGLTRFLGDMHANALLEGKTDRKTIDPVGFIQALIKTVPNIIKHNRFNECSTNKSRATAHMMVLFGFIGLFVVTGAFFAAEWVFHIEGPYSQINPFKWLGNLGGIALLIGGGLMIASRLGQKDQATSYKDWYLLGLVLMLGGTGLLTEMLRLGGMYGLMAVVYVLHLIFVWALFAYTPFSKLAHLVYRTVAMAYMEYSGRK